MRKSLHKWPLESMVLAVRMHPLPRHSAENNLWANRIKCGAAGAATINRRLVHATIDCREPVPVWLADLRHQLPVARFKQGGDEDVGLSGKAWHQAEAHWHCVWSCGGHGL